MALQISKNDFKLFKTIPPIIRIIAGVILLLGGLAIQITLPINGLYPFEQREISPVAFFLGYVVLIIALLLLFPERLVVSEEPKLVDDETPIWIDTSMKQMSNVFNVINKRKKENRSKIAFFDLNYPKGKWTFSLVIIFLTFFYLLILGLTNRLFGSTIIFLLDIYLFIFPVWFIIRIEDWNPDILRKILFFYQFSKDDNLDDYEFSTSAAVQLQRIAEKETDEELMLPINVRFMIEFDEAPEAFDSLSIQITINEYLKNKFPFFVAFLRIRKPKDWKPLKKPEAIADRIVKIKHIVEEDDLHLFVLSKSKKVENPYHTSPREAAKIFMRAEKMMRDFA